MNSDLLKFIVKAKKSTYASSKQLIASSRMSSKDLYFEESDYRYLDSYFGDKHFAGQEIVWYKDKAVWGMNYVGRVLAKEAPLGFIDFLKESLLKVDKNNPYRGPEEFKKGDFMYMCKSYGRIDFFDGKEMIMYKNKAIYELVFNGGKIE